MKKLFLAVLAGSMAILTACDPEEVNKFLNGEVPAESVELSQARAEIAVGETLTLTATVKPENSTDKVEWISPDESVATVQDGVVTGVGPGVVRIQARAGGVSDFCSVTVKSNVSGSTEITLSDRQIELEIGQTKQLTATVTPELPAGPRVVWSSSDTDVATVTTGDEVAADGTYLPAGLVTAVGAGEAIITASIEGHEAQCKVTVKKAATGGDGLIVSPDKVTILKNEKTQLMVTDATGAAVKVTWSSSDTMVAVVDENNELEARNPGSAIVTATAADGKTGTCEVTVTDEVPVQSIAFNPDQIEMNIGETRQLTVVYTPANTTRKVNVWVVRGGNPTVTVDDKGVVTAVQKGTAEVVAGIDPEQIMAVCTVKVNDPDNPDIPVESISLDKTSATVYVNQERPLILTATVTPETALKDKSIEWKSSNPTKVLVEAINATQAKVAGLVAGSKETVTAYIGGKSATCEVTVEQQQGGGQGGGTEVSSISLDQRTLDMTVGQTAQLTATVLPESAAGVTVTWSSSNPDVAYVTNDSVAGADGSVGGTKGGMVIARSAGSATITASAGGKEATCQVTVTGGSGGGNGETIPVQSVTLNKHELQLSVGQQFQLVATVLPENATEKGVVWISNVQSSKLYIDTDGKVSGLQACEATITVRCKDNAQIYDTCQVTVTGGSSGGTVDEVVDLGLPSGLKWRSMNVGASKPEDYGNYYAWAETTPKSSYTSANYKYPATSYSDGITIYKKYDTTPGGDGKTVLEAEDDAATANLGNGWRTPTSREFKELRENCTWTWKNDYNGVKGMLVTGPNGKSIFLPAGGWYEPSLQNRGSYGSYWTASGNGGTVSAVDFINNDKSAALLPRCTGRSVRPVKD